jgi:hypothetical protein
MKLSEASIEHLARRFLDATVNRRGTNEPEVESVLAEVRFHGVADAFEKKISNLIDPRKRADLLAQNPGRLVPAILRSELSGPDLARAEFLAGLRDSPSHWTDRMGLNAGLLRFYDLDFDRLAARVDDLSGFLSGDRSEHAKDPTDRGSSGWRVTPESKLPAHSRIGVNEPSKVGR